MQDLLSIDEIKDLFGYYLNEVRVDNIKIITSEPFSDETLFSNALDTSNSLLFKIYKKSNNCFIFNIYNEQYDRLFYQFQIKYSFFRYKLIFTIFDEYACGTYSKEIKESSYVKKMRNSIIHLFNDIENIANKEMVEEKYKYAIDSMNKVNTISGYNRKTNINKL